MAIKFWSNPSSSGYWQASTTKKCYRHGSSVLAGEDSNDDDYMPTVKEKEKVEKEKRREMQQKLQDGEFISNAAERAKVFKWETDPLIFYKL